jgi:hypothetical protein
MLLFENRNIWHVQYEAYIHAHMDIHGGDGCEGIVAIHREKHTYIHTCREEMVARALSRFTGRNIHTYIHTCREEMVARALSRFAERSMSMQEGRGEGMAGKEETLYLKVRVN